MYASASPVLFVYPGLPLPTWQCTILPCWDLACDVAACRWLQSGSTSTPLLLFFLQYFDAVGWVNLFYRIVSYRLLTCKTVVSQITYTVLAEIKPCSLTCHSFCWHDYLPWVIVAVSVAASRAWNSLLTSVSLSSTYLTILTQPAILAVQIVFLRILCQADISATRLFVQQFIASLSLIIIMKYCCSHAHFFYSIYTCSFMLVGPINDDDNNNNR